MSPDFDLVADGDLVPDEVDPLPDHSPKNDYVADPTDPETHEGEPE